MADPASETATECESQLDSTASSPPAPNAEAVGDVASSTTPPAVTSTASNSPEPSQRTDPSTAGDSSDRTVAEPFGANLEPVLREACDHRLSRISWFRTDWQRGGALTGTATYQTDAGRSQPVVVKLPVPPRERAWLTELQGELDVVPVVYAHGETVGGYDLAWVVMEHLPHGPLGPQWNGGEFDLLLEATGRFYEATEAVAPPDGASPIDRDWGRLLELAKQQVANGAVADGKAWKTALKKADRKLEGWLERWQARPIAQWCHGDLHLANAMTRTPPPDGPALLLDLAQVRPGHWVEDAVYFEHLYWGCPDRVDGRKLCKQLARVRRNRGLALDDDWAEFAQLKRALLAMAAPARLNVEGSQRHLDAALAVLQRHVK